jgi:hypothetical protein
MGTKLFAGRHPRCALLCTTQSTFGIRCKLCFQSSHFSGRFLLALSTASEDYSRFFFVASCCLRQTCGAFTRFSHASRSGQRAKALQSLKKKNRACITESRFIFGPRESEVTAADVKVQRRLGAARSAHVVGYRTMESDSKSTYFVLSLIWRILNQLTEMDHMQKSQFPGAELFDMKFIFGYYSV